MTRERITRALLRTYPAPTRASLGSEMIGTVLDSSDASRRLFARECTALIVAGARARARASASETTIGKLLDGYVLAGQIWLGVLLSHGTGQLLRNPAQGVTGGLLFVMALWPILGMSLVGTRRAAGSAAVAWFVCLIVVFGQPHPNVTVIWLIPLSGCVAMATSQKNRPRDRRRLLWLAPVAIMSLLPPGGEGMFTPVQIDGLILGSALAIATFPINPRALVACAVLWTSIGLVSDLPRHNPEALSLLAVSALLMLLASTGCVALARRRRAGP
jgi:hypothetical protein